MPATKPIGIRLELVGRPFIEKSHGVQFQLIVGTYQRGKPFFTSPIIKQTITDLKIKSGKWIGDVTIRFDHTTKRAITIWYHPTMHEKRLSGIGIPDLLDIQLHKFVKKHFPQYQVIEDLAIEEARIGQLNKQGRDFRTPTPVSVAKERAKKKAIAQYKKYRHLIRRRTN